MYLPRTEHLGNQYPQYDNTLVEVIHSYIISDSCCTKYAIVQELYIKLLCTVYMSIDMHGCGYSAMYG